MDGFSIKTKNHTDLNMYQCGIEDCEPGHSFGPAVRDHFLIHYILDGKGSFHVGNNVYRLEKGQGFLICPGIVTYYQADLKEPWNYTWVGFHGIKAESYLKRAGLTAEAPIFRYDRDDFIKDCFQMMIDTKRMNKSREIRSVGLLYIFLAQLIEAAEEISIPAKRESRKEVYVKKAIEYMDMNYSRNISISEISHYIGLDRSYFCSVFKEFTSTAPQKFLINLRISKACELMENMSLAIGDISRSVGYDDPLQFSKIFKKVRGLSPKEFRNRSII